MYKYLIIAVTFLSYSSTASANFWSACNETLRTVDYIETPMCTQERCYAVRGEDFVANVTISSPYVHQELLSEFWVQIFGLWINFPMEYPHDNGCQVLYQGDRFVGCPTTPHVPHHWVIKQPIVQWLPAFQNSLVRYFIRDRGTIVGCVQFYATLV